MGCARRTPARLPHKSPGPSFHPHPSSTCSSWVGRPFRDPRQTSSEQCARASRRATAYPFALSEPAGPLPRGALAHVAQRPGVEAAIDPYTHVWARVAVRDAIVALDDCEASLVGIFPVAFHPATLELADRARSGHTPPGVIGFGWR